jgi:hypothetical protein
MADLRQYQTYYGIHLVHYEHDWGAVSYNKILSKSLPVGDDFLITTDYTVGHTASFIYPLKYLNAYYLDGLLEGWFSIYNSTSTVSLDVDSYTIKLQKSDNVPNNITDLATYTYTLTGNKTVNKEDYITLPIYMEIDHKLIEENEKLILRIEITASGDTTPYLAIAHANTTTGGTDMQIKIPYAPEA